MRCTGCFLLTILLIISSCKTFTNPNENFQGKFEEQLEMMRLQRTLFDGDISESSAPPTMEELIKQNPNAAPYVDVKKFGEQPSQNFINNLETYDLSAPLPGGLPSDVFEIKYNLALYPAFRRVGLEFDTIRVPRYDAYGVPTRMSDKNYSLLGGRILQKTVDEIHRDKASYDNEISEILIAKRKENMRRKQTEKIFGSYDDIKILSERALQKEEKKENKEYSNNTEETKPQSNYNAQNNSGGFIIRSVKKD